MNFAGEVAVEPLSRRDWASVTFTGSRHRLRVTLEGTGGVGAAADFLALLPEADLPLPGHFVADVVPVTQERRDGGAYASLELEALTIEAA